MKPTELVDKIINTIESERPRGADDPAVDMYEAFWDQIDRRKLVYKQPDVPPNLTYFEVSPFSAADLTLVYRHDSTGNSKRPEYFARMVEFLIRHHDQDFERIRIELNDESTIYNRAQFNIEYDRLSRRS